VWIRKKDYSWVGINVVRIECDISGQLPDVQPYLTVLDNMIQISIVVTIFSEGQVGLLCSIYIYENT